MQNQPNEPSGVLCVRKGLGMTSHDVVNIVRRLFHLRRVGHTGTLDPDASGVLVVLVGRAAKAAEYITAADKRYRATLRLGMTTDTGDIGGNVLTTADSLPAQGAVLAILDQFRGEIQQIPPMYSALKQDGRKLVDLARKGIEVERQPRPVEIFSLEAARLNDADYVLDVHCSKGTYIRTLCEDIGAALGCGGTMAALERSASGSFTLADCVTLDELADMTEEERLARLLPIEQLFDDCPALELKEFFAHLAHSGCEIYQKKVGASHPVGTRVRMYDEEGFFALGEVMDYPDGSAVKPVKQFRLD